MSDQTRPHPSGRVAVVTGAVHGVSRAIAERLLRDGAAVSILDVDPKGGSHAVEELTAAGGPVSFEECDVRTEPQAERAFQSVTEWFGAVHTLVNNAGINAFYDATNMTETQ